jgi:hypothetical protein
MADTHPLDSRGLFVPLDVNYADDPKVLEAGVEAELLYVRSLAIAKRIGTDGRIHKMHLIRLTFDMPSVAWEGHDPLLIAAALVKCGLWIEDADGWRISAWERWNLTASEIEERRRGKARGGAIGNHRRWHEARDVVDPDCEYCTASDDPSDTDSVEGSHRESTKTKTKGVSSDNPRRGKTAMPEEFTLTAEMVAWVTEKYPTLDYDRHTEGFVAWAKANDRRYSDWLQAWRNWMHRKAEDATKGAFR